MKKVNVILSLLYITGLLISSYVLYQLPMNLVKVQAIDLAQLERSQSVFNQLYMVVGLSLALGMIVLVALWLIRQKDNKSSNIGSSEVDQSYSQRGYEEESKSDENTVLVEGIDAVAADSKNEEEAFTKALSIVCHTIEASQAVAYRTKRTEEYGYIELFASFAYHAPEGEATTYRFGEGLAGQVAKQGECVIMDTVPEGYLEILSGLGKASPTHLMIIPMKHNDQVVGVIEIASFKEFSNHQKRELPTVFDQLALKFLNSDNVSLAEAAS